MPLAHGRSSRSTRVRPPVSSTLTRPSITSVAYRLPLGSKATSSGAMMSPPLALTVSSRPVLEIQCADLAAGHLRDVDAAVGTGAQTVGAEQPAGRGEPLESPALGDGGRVAAAE